MKVLVIDDTQVHQAAALAQFKDHDVTVAGSYEEGEKFLVGENDQPHGFEVVLVDLLMPASKKTQNAEGLKLAGSEMPLGIFLVLLAAKNGAKYVALLTDSNHHCHPASACIDVFNDKQWLDGSHTPIQIAAAKVILTNDYQFVELFHRDDLSKVYTDTPKRDDSEWQEKWVKIKEVTVRAKSWRKLFNYLIA